MVRTTRCESRSSTARAHGFISRTARNRRSWSRARETKRQRGPSRRGARSARRRTTASSARRSLRPTSVEMEKWLDAWLADRRKRGLTTTGENASHYEHHIKPALGTKHVREWEPSDLRLLVAELDAKVQRGDLKWKSASNIWMTTTRICRDACSSKVEALRVRNADDNPAKLVAGPDRGALRSRQFLYPSEFAAFVACEDVPLSWRRAVALAVYLFPRADELRELQWNDIDLEHGVVHIHRKDARSRAAALRGRSPRRREPSTARAARRNRRRAKLDDRSPSSASCSLCSRRCTRSQVAKGTCATCRRRAGSHEDFGFGSRRPA